MSQPNHPEPKTPPADIGPKNPPAAPIEKPQPAPASLSKKILALVLSLIVAMFLGELLLRLFWNNPYRNEEPSRVIELRMQHPHTDQVFNRKAIAPDDSEVRFRTDARGYILPSRQHETPDATVAFLGGSTTECSVVAEEARFPALTSKVLAEQGLKVNTLNAGRSGNTAHDSINLLVNHVVIDRPDFVVLMHAANDTGLLTRSPDYASRMGDSVSAGSMSKWSLQIASGYSYLAALVRKLATTHSPNVRTREDERWRYDASHAAGIPIEPYRQRLTGFVALCRSFGITPVLMTEPLSGTTNELTPDWANLGAQDRFNEVIRSVGREQNVTVIDLARHLKETVPNWDKPMEVFYDGMHVTDRGSEIYARHIAEQLASVIAELRRKPAGQKP